jgi:hypothetical protein
VICCSWRNQYLRVCPLRELSLRESSGIFVLRRFERGLGFGVPQRFLSARMLVWRVALCRGAGLSESRGVRGGQEAYSLPICRKERSRDPAILSNIGRVDFGLHGHRAQYSRQVPVHRLSERYHFLERFGSCSYDFVMQCFGIRCCAWARATSVNWQSTSSAIPGELFPCYLPFFYRAWVSFTFALDLLRGLIIVLPCCGRKYEC